MSTKVAVLGAAGKMGYEVVKAVMADPDLSLVGMVGGEASDIAFLDKQEELNDVYRTLDLVDCLESTKPDIAVDFTHPSAVFNNVMTCLDSRVSVVVGTTGLSKEKLDDIRNKTEETNTAAAIIPNFSIGAVLMMKCAAMISEHMPYVEIIELHHDNKADAPSGTAIKTAELIAEKRPKVEQNSIETIQGARGALVSDVYIHSVRLPSLFAHEEIIFAASGQTLTLRHDTFNRECYMPGVVSAVKALENRTGFYYGLEKLLNI